MGNGGTVAAGATLIRMGLYTFDGTTATLVARTASDTTLFNTQYAIYTRSFDTTGGYPATYNLVAGQRYGFSVIIVGTTMPTVYGMTLGSNVGGAIGNLAPKLSAYRGGQTDLLTTNTVFTATQTIYWARGS